MNALVYVDIDQGIHKGRMKVAWNEKRKKLCRFSFSINIANFEAFLSVFRLTKNLLFLKSAYWLHQRIKIDLENRNHQMKSHLFTLFFRFLSIVTGKYTVWPLFMTFSVWKRTVLLVYYYCNSSNTLSSLYM